MRLGSQRLQPFDLDDDAVLDQCVFAEEVAQARDRPAGHLRVNLPGVVAERMIAPHLPAFMAQRWPAPRASSSWWVPRAFTAFAARRPERVERLVGKIDALPPSASARERIKAFPAVNDVTGPHDEALADAQPELHEHQLVVHEAPPVGEAAAPFWESVGILPVEVVVPEGAGVTLRCYVEDVARFLGRDGLAVAVAHDGEAGLAMARDLQPSAILLDVVMPRKNGKAVYDAPSIEKNAPTRPL